MPDEGVPGHSGGWYGSKPAEPNCMNGPFSAAFFGAPSNIIGGFVDLDYGWNTFNPDNICKIFPNIGDEVTVADLFGDRIYSSGLVFTNYIQEEGEEGEEPVTKFGIIKNEVISSAETQGYDGIRIRAYDYDTGAYVNTLAVYDEFVEQYYSWDTFPGAVAISPDGLELWFSITTVYLDDCWIKCTRATTDGLFGTPVKQFDQPGAWKVLWDNSGEIWFAGRDQNSWNDPACIYRSTSLTKKISINGHSAGFAFDNFGNLWVGTYTDDFGPASQQYVFVFGYDKVYDQVNPSAVLYAEDADATYDMPTLEGQDGTYFTGVCDILYSGGFMYISANGGFSDETKPIGCVLKITTHEGTDDDPFAAQEDLEKIYTGPQTDDYDWVKSIAIGAG